MRPQPPAERCEQFSTRLPIETQVVVVVVVVVAAAAAAAAAVAVVTVVVAAAAVAVVVVVVVVDQHQPAYPSHPHPPLVRQTWFHNPLVKQRQKKESEVSSQHSFAQPRHTD